MKNKLLRSGLIVLSLGVATIAGGHIIGAQREIDELGIMCTLVGAPLTLMGLIFVSVSLMKSSGS